MDADVRVTGMTEVAKVNPSFSFLLLAALLSFCDDASDASNMVDARRVKCIAGVQNTVRDPQNSRKPRQTNMAMIWETLVRSDANY